MGLLSFIRRARASNERAESKLVASESRLVEYARRLARLEAEVEIVERRGQRPK